MKVSVILPTYQRENLLCQTIKDLLRQDYTDFELLVLDQSPTHEVETKRFLDSVASHIRYIHFEKPGVVAACNEGVRNASGEILLFIDDDISIPDNKLLERHVRNYEDPLIGGVAGKILDAANPVERELFGLTKRVFRQTRGVGASRPLMSATHTLLGETPRLRRARGGTPSLR